MDEELRKMIAGFVEDCREGFESMEEDLMAMEEDPEDLDIINNLFRVMHTLKGTAGFMDLNDIQSYSHKMESIFDLVREHKLEMTPKLLDFLLPAIDKLKEMVFGQIGEYEIPEITEELSTLEKIIETCSDEVLSGVSPSQTRDPKNPTPPPVKSGEDEIDFDAIEATYGGNIPLPGQTPPRTDPPPRPVEIEVPPPPTPPTDQASAELLQQFVVEAEEHLEVIEESLLALEENSAKEGVINEFFRAIHSIKGTAGYVNLKQIEVLSHRVETIFDLLRKGDLKYTKEIGDVVFKSIDRLRTMVFYIKTENYSHVIDITDQLRQLAGIVAGEKPAVPLPPPRKTSEDVDIGKLNTFLAEAQQPLEVLNSYRNELEKGALNEHDLITLHRSLKTLNAGAKYCELTALEAAIGDYEEILLKILGGEIEQSESVINETIKPSHHRIVEAVEKLQNRKPSQTKEVEPPPAQQTKPIAMELAAEPLPPAASDSKNIPIVSESALAVERSSVEIDSGEIDADLSETSRAQHRAARQITNKVAEEEDTESKGSAKMKTMRVDANRLDRFMNLIGELIIARNAFKHVAETMDDKKTVAEIIQNIKLIENNISRISDNLQDNLMDMRLVQVRLIFQRMPRIVRDISRKTSKKITLQMIGESTEVDKSIVEEIGDPLVHIIRNSCDHGIESPEVRVAAGKTEQGTITLKAGHMGSFIAIDVLDDGGGIDPQIIKKLAVEKGMIAQEASDQMSESEAINLIFAPGFSTVEEISDISGRGVGMDVVISNIRKVQGSVEVSSKLGQGTQVRLKLPLTLAVIDALIVGVKEASYAIPLDAIKETVQVEKASLLSLKDKLALDLRGEILGVTPLTELLRLEPATERVNEADPAIVSIVVLAVNDREIGIAVDQLFTQQEVVVKPLEDYLSTIPGLKGSTIMGDGQVVLILEPNELMEMAVSGL